MAYLITSSERPMPRIFGGKALGVSAKAGLGSIRQARLRSDRCRITKSALRRRRPAAALSTSPFNKPSALGVLDRPAAHQRLPGPRFVRGRAVRPCVRERLPSGPQRPPRMQPVPRARERHRPRVRPCRGTLRSKALDRPGLNAGGREGAAHAAPASNLASRESQRGFP
jgi:hypothetical protein